VTGTGEELERRIVDLELRFMRQEKLVDDLNDVVVEQRREIDRLLAEVKALREQILAGAEAVGNERPPHY
jgi:SlyX protein